jgi:hypothetical protein
VNQTNLKRVILPTVSSASSGVLRSDVRSDVTTKVVEETRGRVPSLDPHDQTAPDCV